MKKRIKNQSVKEALRVGKIINKLTDLIIASEATGKPMDHAAAIAAARKLLHGKRFDTFYNNDPVYLANCAESVREILADWGWD